MDTSAKKTGFNQSQGIKKQKKQTICFFCFYRFISDFFVSDFFYSEKVGKSPQPFVFLANTLCHYICLDMQFSFPTFF